MGNRQDLLSKLRTGEEGGSLKRRETGKDRVGDYLKNSMVQLEERERGRTGKEIS